MRLESCIFLSIEFVHLNCCDHFRDFIEIEYFDIGRLGILQQLKELRIILDDEFVRYSSFSFSGGLSAIGELRHLRILVSNLERNNPQWLFDSRGSIFIVLSNDF